MIELATRAAGSFVLKPSRKGSEGKEAVANCEAI
jgi:hypothetical protein